MHFGPKLDHDAYKTTSYSHHDLSGFYRDFHKYELVWNESGIKFMVDGTEIGYVAADKGFWKRGDFTGNDIWESTTKMAPFDEEVNEVYSNIKLNTFFSNICLFSVLFKFEFSSWWH